MRFELSQRGVSDRLHHVVDRGALVQHTAGQVKVGLRGLLGAQRRRKQTNQRRYQIFQVERGEKRIAFNDRVQTQQGNLELVVDGGYSLPDFALFLQLYRLRFLLLLGELGVLLLGQFLTESDLFQLLLVRVELVLFAQVLRVELLRVRADHRHIVQLALRRSEDLVLGLGDRSERLVTQTGDDVLREHRKELLRVVVHQGLDAVLLDLRVRVAVV